MARRQNLPAQARAPVGRTGAVQQHREFIASQPRQHIFRRQQGGDAPGQKLEQMIAALAPEPLIHRLELVDIEGQQGDHAIGTGRSGHRRRHLFGEMLAVGQVGERVIMRQPEDARLIRAALGDVAQRHGGGGLALEGDGLAAGLDDDLALIGPQQHKFPRPGARRLELGAQAGHLVRPRQRGEALAQPFALAHPQHAHQRPVHEQDNPLAMDEQAVKAGISQAALPQPARRRLGRRLMAEQQRLAAQEQQRQPQHHQGHKQAWPGQIIRMHAAPPRLRPMPPSARRENGKKLNRGSTSGATKCSFHATIWPATDSGGARGA